MAGHRLVAVRDSVGWSRADLADALGLDDWTLASFERETAPPWTVLALAGLLISESDLSSAEAQSLILGPSHDTP